MPMRIAVTVALLLATVAGASENRFASVVAPPPTADDLIGAPESGADMPVGFVRPKAPLVSIVARDTAADEPVGARPLMRSAGLAAAPEPSRSQEHAQVEAAIGLDAAGAPAVRPSRLGIGLWVMVLVIGVLLAVALMLLLSARRTRMTMRRTRAAMTRGIRSATRAFRKRITFTS